MERDEVLEGFLRLAIENQTLATKNQTLKTDNQTLKTELDQRSLAVLKNDKTKLVNRTDSEPHVKKLKYEKASIHRVDYDFNDGVSVPHDAPDTRADFSIDSEADVQLVLHGILRAIAFKTSQKIHFALNRRIAGVECDI